MDPLQIRDRFPGVTVTLDRTMASPSQRPSRIVRSRTESSIPLHVLHTSSAASSSGVSTSTDLPEPALSRLPPAVATVPRDDTRSYVHSKKVNNYLIGSTLGEGSFAKVKEAFHVLVGEKVAMKIIDKKKAMQDPYVAKNFKREAKLLQKLRHPNIVQLYEVIETENNYYLITELCSGGELMKHIYRTGKLPESETRKYVRQIVSAVDHLHRAGLIHRDLKVENLLLDSNMDLKLIDFGLSNEEFTIDESGKELHCRTQCGSPAYAAPELLGQKQYDRAVDIWSIGVNMYAMLTGCLPYTVEPFNITTLHAKMLQNKMNPIPDSLSQNCKDLLKRLLTASPESRITMSEIFDHPWLNEDHTLPFQPAPYPNTIALSQINGDIVDHISQVLCMGTPLELQQDLITNRATSLYAAYHLLASRLARYEKEFPSKVTRPHRRSLKKKVSKDQGYFEGDDNVETSSIVSAPVHASIRRDTGKSSGGVRSKRPVSDDFTETVNPYQQTRRLSNIAEERRASMPADLIEKDLDILRKKNCNPSQQTHFPHETVKRPYQRSPNRYSHPQPSHPLPLHHTLPISHTNNMSPPVDPYEFDVGQLRTIKPHSIPKELNHVPNPAHAWNSNPPSRSGSRASLYVRLPSLKSSSQSVDLDDEDLEFHEIGPATPTAAGRPISFHIEPQNSSPSPINTPGAKTMSSMTGGNPKKRATSLRRKNGIVIPPSGDFEIKTHLQISAVMGELLRVAQSMRMKTAEPTSTTTLHCNHRSVDLNISIRRKSIGSCMIHFEWVSGGSYQVFNEICQDIIRQSQM